MKFRDPKTGEVFEDIQNARISFCVGRRCYEDCQFGCATTMERDPAEAARLLGLEVVEDMKPARTKPISIERLKMLSKLPVYLHIFGQWEGYAFLRHIDIKRKRFRFNGAPNLNFADYTRTWEAFEKKEESTMGQVNQTEQSTKPRICQVLGVEIGENVTYSDPQGGELDFCVLADGNVKFTFKRGEKAGNIGMGYAILQAINHPERIIHKPRFTEEEVAALRALYNSGAKYVVRGRSMIGWITTKPEWNESLGMFTVPNGISYKTGDLPDGIFPSLCPGQLVKLADITGATP